jgi:hypothetical protein
VSAQAPKSWSTTDQAQTNRESRTLKKRCSSAQNEPLERPLSSA